MVWILYLSDTGEKSFLRAQRHQADRLQPAVFLTENPGRLSSSCGGAKKMIKELNYENPCGDERL
jgi:hypothetical protein